MTERRHGILQAIVRNFIKTASPIGSKALRSSEEMTISAATIRNEMAALEEEGLLEHPHTSAGRIPTAQGYRFYVDKLEVSERDRRKMTQQFSKARDEHYQEKVADQRVFDAIAILTKIIPNIAFATVPSAKRTFFLGLSNVLKEPEFSQDVKLASQIIKVLEEEFAEALNTIDITEETSLFIGPENFLDGFETCSLLAFQYDVIGKKGIIGILGPMRMPYERNILALEATRTFLQEKLLEA